MALLASSISPCYLKPEAAASAPPVIASVLDWVAERCPVVRLSVLSDNEASLRLTRRFGFVHIGDTPPYIHLEWRCPPTR